MNYGLHLTGMRIALESLQAGSQHPNKMRFTGVLVRLDEASTKAPNGSNGHRIMVPTDVAKRRLGTLIGMGLNYSPDLDTHAQRRKVGVISRAWIDGKDLKVEGHVWKHDFPEAQKDLKQHGLGMSMELGEVRVDDPHADIWTLDDFQFLGATILWKDAAAYKRTQAIAARAEQRSEGMDKTKNKTHAAARTTSQDSKLVQIAAEAAAGAVKKSTGRLIKLVQSQNEALSGIAAQQEELVSRVSALEEGSVTLSADADASEDEDVEAAKDAASSSSSSSEEEGDMETHRMKAKKAEGASSSSSSSEEEEELDSAMDTGDLEEDGKDQGNAGKSNQDAENRGKDGAGDLIKKIGKTVDSARVRALRTENKTLRTKLAAQGTMIEKLQGKMSKLERQVSAAAERTGRRSLGPEITSLLAKANIDPIDLLRTGTKMTVAEVDSILASSGVNFAPQDRMALKNTFVKEGLMEEGRVVRNAR